MSSYMASLLGLISNCNVRVLRGIIQTIIRVDTVIDCLD